MEIDHEFNARMLAEFKRLGVAKDEGQIALDAGIVIRDAVVEILEAAPWKKDPGFASFRRVALAAMWYATETLREGIDASDAGKNAAKKEGV